MNEHGGEIKAAVSIFKKEGGKGGGKGKIKTVAWLFFIQKYRKLIQVRVKPVPSCCSHTGSVQ